MAPKVIAILGLGLIGGSLGLALRSFGPAELNIIGWDQDDQAIRRSLERQAIHHSAVDWEELRKADIVFICTPMRQVVSLIRRIIPYLKQGAVITDVGSVKGCLADELAALMPAGIHYIGGHPMAGREKSGIEAADYKLFQDKWYILTPQSEVTDLALDLLQQVIGWTGSKITIMQPERHDRYAAAISHLPHVVAAGLVNTLGLYGDSDELLELAGGGFRDTTRIASSNPVMWTDICLTNKAEILASITKFQFTLNELAAAVEGEDQDSIARFFTQAKGRRDRMITRYDKQIKSV